MSKRREWPGFAVGDRVFPRHTPNRPLGRVTRVTTNSVAVDFGIEFRWFYPTEIEHADPVSALAALGRSE